jgi:hypothetical protein
MTDDMRLELIKLALQVVIAIGAVGAALFGWMAKTAVQEVSIHLDGRLTQLLEQTASSSRAEGRDSMRGEGGGHGGPGPAGPAGIQGPIGPQGQVGPQGASGEHAP